MEKGLARPKVFPQKRKRKKRLRKGTIKSKKGSTQKPVRKVAKGRAHEEEHSFLSISVFVPRKVLIKKFF